jgi:hypothetical protein
MEQKTLDMLKILTNFFLILCFFVGAYYYITHTAEVNEALNFEKPTRLIHLYEDKTGEYCLCVKKFEDIPLIHQSNP